MAQYNDASPQQLGGTKLVVAALVIAVVAVVANIIYINRIRTENARDTFDVYVLNQSKQTGEKLSWDDVRNISLPSQFRVNFNAAGAMTRDDVDKKIKFEEPFQRKSNQNELLTFNLFTPLGSSGAERITSGYRGLPLTIKQLPPILQPEDHVDIEAPFQVRGQGTVLTVVENVRVVSVGPYTAPEDMSGGRAVRATGYQTITIELKPLEATQLSMVEKAATGPFELHIRRAGETNLVKLPTAGINPEVLRLIPNAPRSIGVNP